MTKSSLPVGRREFSRAHVTFYRAVMDGVEARRAWDLYLSADGDFTDAICNATLAWVRQALISEAVAAKQPGLIGLFRRDPREVRGTAKPTLTEFAERFDGAGDWGESELLEMWKEEYGGPDKAEIRRERLGKRLRQALTLIENAARKAPQPADSVAQWLSPGLAEKLDAAGFRTLGQARAAMDVRRTPRWEEVPGVGEVWADRLQLWFDENGIAKAPSPAAIQARPPGILVPLERFETPVELRPVAVLPVHGHAEVRSPYPAANNALNARDDKHAIEIWLDAKATNPNTRRSYRKNAERLLLWCCLERRVTFPELKVEDCIHYRTWLNDLGRKTTEDWAEAGWRMPAEEWLGPRAAKRDSELWRPFDGPLSANSIAQELLTVTSLFEFLVSGRVLSPNPWKLLGKGSRSSAITAATQQFVGRSFTMDQWKTLVGDLDPHGSETERRLHLILWLGFACGLRASEMLSLTVGSLKPGSEDWRLEVLGKGNKLRTVPLPSPARDSLLAYLDSVGLPYEEVIRITQGPADGSNQAKEMSVLEKALPILRGQRGRRAAGRAAPREPLHYTRLYKLLKAHLKARADDLAKKDPIAAEKFRHASTHWLRHTCATLALKNGVELPAVQRLLGHSSLTVTSTYLTEQDEALQASMEIFANRATR